MAKIENRNYSQEVVNLDDNEFVGCTFQGCTLIYRGGTLPKFTNNSMDQCTWNFSGAAEATLRFISGLYQAGEGGRDVVERMFEQIRSANFTPSPPPPPPAPPAGTPPSGHA